MLVSCPKGQILLALVYRVSGDGAAFPPSCLHGTHPQPTPCRFTLCSGKTGSNMSSYRENACVRACRTLV